MIDDVHFMDEASAELIARVARGIRERRWLIVVARRAHEGGFEVPEGVHPVEVELGPLPADAAVTLVEQLTEDAPLPGHVTDTIAARSAGSPLFVTEMVGALRRGAELDALPRSVEAMMAVQIDDLASADRAVLRQASVLGARFSRASFVQALDLEEAEAEAALARLDRFLVADGEGGIRFRHGLLRDAAYHGLLVPAPARAAPAGGEALERGAGADVTDVADQLTRHFFEAGVWEKALRYGLVAGRRRVPCSRTRTPPRSSNGRSTAGSCAGRDRSSSRGSPSRSGTFGSFSARPTPRSRRSGSRAGESTATRSKRPV